MSLSDGLAVLRLLIVRDTPADVKTIAVELELPEAKTFTASAELRTTQFVTLLPHAGIYAVAEDVLEQLTSYFLRTRWRLSPISRAAPTPAGPRPARRRR